MVEAMAPTAEVEETAAGTAPEAPRTGGVLFRATNPFAKEDRARTWRLLGIALAVLVAAEVVVVLTPWPIALIASIVAGLTIVRLFIFVHDWLHGAIFKDSTAGRIAMECISLLVLTAPSVWQETHDYHHRNNAKLLGGSIGSYPVVTVNMWKEMNGSQRFWYAFARHPLTMLSAYGTLFAAGMCISPAVRNPTKHWRAPLYLGIHLVTFPLLGVLVGWKIAILGMLLPCGLAMTAGAYLFYAQHNFPDVKLRDRTEWDYTHAALYCSSMFEMNELLHWFTGDIGFHHVHHLNHRIPFYRLREAMAAVPELQNPGRTSWAPSDVWACLRLKLWDPEQGRMVGWEALS